MSGGGRFARLATFTIERDEQTERWVVALAPTDSGVVVPLAYKRTEAEAIEWLHLYAMVPAYAVPAAAQPRRAPGSYTRGRK